MKEKLVVLIVAMVFAIPLTAFAARDGGAGCGIGALIMNGKSTKNDHIAASGIEFVINYFIPFQLFGMTTGTLGCDTSGKIEPATSGSAFIQQNKAQFIADVSRGEGEVLSNFMAIIGVEKDDETIFKSSLKTNFAKIFNGPHISSIEIASAINLVLAADEQLSKYAT